MHDEKLLKQVLASVFVVAAGKTAASETRTHDKVLQNIHL
jgi:hypothetical protein